MRRVRERLNPDLSLVGSVPLPGRPPDQSLGYNNDADLLAQSLDAPLQHAASQILQTVGRLRRRALAVSPESVLAFHVEPLEGFIDLFDLFLDVQWLSRISPVVIAAHGQVPG
jgi:hypothetical protein